jgi:PleD family two-component response regulator
MGITLVYSASQTHPVTELTDQRHAHSSLIRTKRGWSIDRSVSTWKLDVVDDNRHLQIAFKKILTSSGYQVELAGDGEEGLRLATSIKPDAILLDMMLPKLGGLDAADFMCFGSYSASPPSAFFFSLSRMASI